MTLPGLWATADIRNGLATVTKKSPDFSQGECQIAEI